MNKILLILFLIGNILNTTIIRGQNTCPLIPCPQNSSRINETFQLSNRCVIVYNEEFEPQAYLLQKELLRYTSIAVSTLPDKETQNSNIVYNIIKLKKGYKFKTEGYSLKMHTKDITITAEQPSGMINGIMSLIQLTRLSTQQDTLVPIECWEIEDNPLYAWRGFMLDEARHFCGIKKVKQILNWMALYKLNRFHWHLTDSQGWRIEIKKYPKLALIGGIGNYGEEYTPAQFYTQEEIKEIVTYALERNIHIIPEIDMPGHASAASKAYPEFSGGGSPKYPGYTFNPGKDSVYTYLTDILKEVDALFPSQVIHLGGDEVHYGNQDWNTNKDIQDLMKHEKMKNLKDVENYFFQRMADSLLLIHNKVAAWDEVADSQLSPEHTIVFFWRQNRPEQLQKSLARKFNIVLCPRLPMYLDYAQDTLQVHGVDWRKFSCNSYQKVYSFSPQDIPVKYPKNCNILGIQANLWTERIETEDRLDYMLFPRIAALAENAWTKEMNKDINSFNIRLKKQFDLYKKDHIYYSDPFTPKETGEPVR